MDINWKDQIKVGDLTLSNRVIMATMTRERCDPKLGIPTPLVA
jgi:2,4-dienoyl-CoA reductase-like NADH-dependent reductase (Old Yellow Enzyme family)